MNGWLKDAFYLTWTLLNLALAAANGFELAKGGLKGKRVLFDLAVTVFYGAFAGFIVGMWIWGPKW